MKVRELRTILAGLPADMGITMWIDGTRVELSFVDTAFTEEGFIELTGEIPEGDVHCLKCDHVWHEAHSPDVCPVCGNADKQTTVYLSTEGESK
jgi:Zn finger protein HypA/HybF involved in hydrogenase expression